MKFGGRQSDSRLRWNVYQSHRITECGINNTCISAHSTQMTGNSQIAPSICHLREDIFTTSIVFWKPWTCYNDTCMGIAHYNGVIIGRDSVSNHQHHDCSLNLLFRRRSKKTSKLRVTGLCAGNSPGTGEFPAQMASNAENVSIWWCHHEVNWDGHDTVWNIYMYSKEIKYFPCSLQILNPKKCYLYVCNRQTDRIVASLLKPPPKRTIERVFIHYIKFYWNLYALYPTKYEHGFVKFCFILVMLSLYIHMIC